MQKRLFFLVAMLLTMTLTAVAQVTTSSMAGKVTFEGSDETIIGATVQAVHEPSGTRYTAVTNANGRYAIQGMRTGGPYNVTVSYIGHQTKTLRGITLQLAETYILDVWLSEDANQLTEVLVSGKASKFSVEKTGAVTNITSAQITNLPTVSRSITDVTRLSPYGGNGMSFVGSDGRLANFTIDGANFNNNFGLSSNLPGGGNPVSIDAIEEMQVVIAPFDVRQTNFIGGGVHAITKSGTNTFKGSAYIYHQNENLRGDAVEREQISGARDKDRTTTYGFTLGGPIIKDKLFFFMNFEKDSDTYPNVYGYTTGTTTSKVDMAKALEIYDAVVAQSKAAGYEYTGSLPSNQDNYTKSNKATVKLDWNINKANKLSFRWGLVDAKKLNSTSGASSLCATDYSYDFVSKTNNFVAELQSRLSDNLSNELRVSYVRVRDHREPKGDPFPMIQINNVGGGTLYLGNERSSEKNHLYQDSYVITDNLTWYKDNHTITFGTHNEFYTFTNLFLQDVYGTYYFSNPSDFLTSFKLNQYRVQLVNTDITGTEDWEPTFHAGQFGLYAQDKWAVNDKFELTYGLRLDMPVFFDVPDENEPFTAYAKSRGWDVKTNQMPKATPLFSPRVGFRYDIAGDGKYILRGGVGLFTGRIPFVWFSNNFSNTGVQFQTYNVYSSGLGGVAAIKYNPKGQAEVATALTPGGSQTINVMDPDFKMAQTAKLDLGFDFNALGIDWTVEGIYSKTINDILYNQLSYEANNTTYGATYTDQSFDTRPMYTRTAGVSPFNNIYMLTNTNKGRTINLMLQAQKSFPFGLDLNASYTYTNAKGVFNGTSSVAQSNFNYNYHHSNPNSPEMGNSAFNIPHQIKVSASYHKSYGRGNAWTTSAGAVYIGTSGAAYSIYYYGDLNNDSSNGNDLMWIPTDAQVEKMTFVANSDYTAAQQADNMKAWLGSERYLKDHRGEYYDRYADNMPFESHFDLHLGQKYSFRVAGQIHSVELTADLINAANLLNPKWGRSYGGGLNGYFSPVTYKGSGKFQFLQPADYTMFNYSDFASRWKLQLGLRYSF